MAVADAIMNLKLPYAKIRGIKTGIHTIPTKKKGAAFEINWIDDIEADVIRNAERCKLNENKNIPHGNMEGSVFFTEVFAPRYGPSYRTWFTCNGS